MVQMNQSENRNSYSVWKLNNKLIINIHPETSLGWLDHLSWTTCIISNNPLLIYMWTSKVTFNLLTKTNYPKFISKHFYVLQVTWLLSGSQIILNSFTRKKILILINFKKMNYSRQTCKTELTPFHNAVLWNLKFLAVCGRKFVWVSI